MNIRKLFIVLAIVALGIVAALSYFWINALWAMVIIGPVILIGIMDMLQQKQTIRRNFPVIGNLRYLLENIRPEIMQYFVETDLEGRPINRIFRTLIYERAKKVNDTTPFGTQLNVYETGYEWMSHSIYANRIQDLDKDPRTVVGGKDCKQPYSASLLNISAMSYGSLSKNAILALNGGAKLGNFAHNTGEGGISPYHLKYGGDLIWQIGTGYFGCRNDEGNFDAALFKLNSNLPSVKMIEIKFSQGAKPGHGGILPAKKNTLEIAKIRNVKKGTSVLSPPSHSAFSNPVELCHFIKQLRALSNGKPIGFKLCIGIKSEFIELCKAFIKTGIMPDFITVDGGEGGTGAAPVEFANSVGVPLREGLAFVHDTLIGFNIRKDIKIIASGKIFMGFHMARVLALGADLCNSARAMMLALGCIQAKECHSNTCPTGVATQNKHLIKGLVVEDKIPRVKNFHDATVHSLVEMLAATGVKDANLLNRTHIYRRTEMDETKRYDEIYPLPETGCLLNEDTIPEYFKLDMK